MLYEFEHRKTTYYAGDAIKSLSPRPHIHPHLELIYLSKGSSLATADTVTELLTAGDIYLSFPNQIHYYMDQEPVDLCILIVSPDLFPDLQDIFHEKIPTSPIVSKEKLPANTAQRLTQICEYFNSEDPLSQAAAKGYLQGLLAEILKQMDLVKHSANSDSVKEILQYCSQNYTEPLTLEILAKELHLSKFYISHVFTNRLKTSFPEFLNGMRVEHVCRQLRKCVSITQAAYDAGYNSIRSFNRNFERITGMTPTEYAKQKN